MKKKRIYILPTRFGFVFLAGAAIMILIGASYQNNLVNLLSYFMLSLIFIAMIQTHNNLKDVRIEMLETEGGFKGTEFVITTVLSNEGKDSRFGLEASYKGLKLLMAYENVLPLVAHGTLKLRSSFEARERGRHEVDRVKVSSAYPLGLFRAWMWLPVKTSYFVYPEPIGDRPLPAGAATEEPGPTLLSAAGEDFHGHRKYETGDSARHIDWKAKARGRGLLVKEFSGGSPGAVALDWYQLDGISTEAKLSQLSRWVDEARKRKLNFSLRLPRKTLPLAHGLQHSTRCLEALAEYREDREK